MLRTLLYMLILSITFPAYAFNLTGTWHLVFIERQNTSGQWINDCHAPTGMIIYTPSGDMATGINCMQANGAPSFAPQDTAFYIGTYTRKDNYIYHHVQNASSPLYYATTQTRELEVINANEMYLRIKSKTGESVRLKWRRN